MGLTIHYNLQTPLTRAADVRTLVESVRQFARDLPFKEVGDLIECKGDDTDFQKSSPDDPYRWLKIQAQGSVDDDTVYVRVKPQHIIAFETWPGEGCEPANVGLCKFPAFVTASDRSGKKRRIATHLDGWRWGSCCKTQYASSPECDGVRNFLRCHLCVVRLLDFAKNSGLMTVNVSDEGDYWNLRDLKKLATEVGTWNEFLAGLSGMLQRAAEQQGMALESAIMQYPDFEQLEARGKARLDNLLDRTRERKKGD